MSRRNVAVAAAVDAVVAAQPMTFQMRLPSMKMAIHSIQIHSMAKKMFSMPMELPTAVAVAAALKAKASSQARALMKMA